MMASLSVHLLSTLLCWCFFLLLLFLHALDPSLVVPAKERCYVSVCVNLIFIITDLNEGRGRERVSHMKQHMDYIHIQGNFHEQKVVIPISIVLRATTGIVTSHSVEVGVAYHGI